jgi:hypothetical protein
MSNASTVILVPFILAFLVFILRFYGREHAASMRNPSFMLAVITVGTAGAYLLLRIADSLPHYGTIGFGLVGVALLVAAIARMFMI